MTYDSPLKKASKCVTERRAVYGGPEEYFLRAAKMATLWLEDKLAPGAEIAPRDVAMLMAQWKMARLMESPQHEDSIVDICGYMDCYAAVINNGS